MSEIWRDHPVFTGYQVSDLGRVRSVDRWATNRSGRPYFRPGRLLRPQPNRDGYLQVHLSIGGVRWSRLVSLLVLGTFEGECPPGHHGHHLNRIRRDNRLVNLAYKPVKAHLTEHFYGERNPAAKLQEADIAEIKALAGLESQRSIARRKGVSQSLVSLIQNRKRWGLTFTLDELPELPS